MKKTLLSLAFAGAIFASATAQVAPDADGGCGGETGLTKDKNSGKYIGFYDDFTSPEYYSTDNTGAGLYPWGDTVAVGVNNPNDQNKNFYGPIMKSGDNGYQAGWLSYRITQHIGEYVPVGIAFGYTGPNNTGAQHVLDLTGTADKSFAVRVINLSGAAPDGYKIYMRVTLQDSLGHTVDTWHNAVNDQNGNYYSYPIQDTLDSFDPGFYDASDAVTFSGSFAGAFKTTYPYTFHPDSSDAANHYVTISDNNGTRQGCPNNPSSLDSTSFHWDAVSGMQFTFFNSEKDAASDWPGTQCYYQSGMEDALVSIDWVRLGACPEPTAIRKASNLVKSLTINPNPATSVATVNYEATGSDIVVKVSDLRGSVVKTVNGTSTSASINVADLTQGMYMVTVEVDGTAASVQKLVVK